MSTPRKKRHRRSGPLSEADKRAGFVACLTRADLMRLLYERHAAENPQLEASRGLFEEPAHLPAFILACFHLACLYETVRAYRAIAVSDPDVDRLLNPSLEQQLRDFRDYTFHFTSPTDERMLAIIGDSSEPVVQAYALHDALSCFVDASAAATGGAPEA